ncbi:MAG: hypothetical protein WBA12_06555, partial [Catalinimonas sp.]
MARYRQFGQTWWGKQWLWALEGIDYSNRLPRGRAYARRGAVLDFNVAPGGVSARVQGTRAHPYRVSLAAVPFTAAQRKEVIKT